MKYSAVNSSVEKHPLLLSSEKFILRLSCTRSATLLSLLTESTASLVPALSVRSHSGCRIQPLSGSDVSAQRVTQGEREERYAMKRRAKRGGEQTGVFWLK